MAPSKNSGFRPPSPDPRQAPGLPHFHSFAEFIKNSFFMKEINCQLKTKNILNKKAIFDKFCEAVKMGQTGGLTGVRARGPKSGVFARGHMALSAEINRFVLYLVAPPLQ